MLNRKIAPLFPLAFLLSGCFGVHKTDTPVWTQPVDGKAVLVSTDISAQTLLVSNQHTERSLITLDQLGSVIRTTASPTTNSPTRVFTTRHGTLLVSRSGNDLMFELFKENNLRLRIKRAIPAADMATDDWKVGFKVRAGRESPFRYLTPRSATRTDYIVSDTSDGLAISRRCLDATKMPAIAGKPKPTLGADCDLTEHIGLDGAVLASFKGFGVLKGNHFIQPVKEYSPNHFRLKITNLTEADSSKQFEVSGSPLGYGFFDNSILLLKASTGESKTYSLQAYTYDGNLLQSHDLPKDTEKSGSSMSFRTTANSVWVLQDQYFVGTPDVNIHITGYTSAGEAILTFPINPARGKSIIRDSYRLKAVVPVDDGILAMVDRATEIQTPLPKVGKRFNGSELYYISNAGELLDSIKPAKKLNLMRGSQGIPCFDCVETELRSGQWPSQIAVLPNLVILKEQKQSLARPERIAAYRLNGVAPL